MAFAEYLQVIKRVELAATGSPGDIVTITLESGTPYRHLVMYLNGNAANVSAQPLFGGQSDGAPTAVAGQISQKIFQVGVDEIRPATRGAIFDGSGILPLKSELKLTNLDANPAVLNIFIVASAQVGGA